MAKYVHLLIIITLIFVCSCKEEKTPDKNRVVKKTKVGGTLNYGSIGDASVLNPILSTDNSSGFVNRLVFSSLLKYNKNYELVGDLAEKWEITENGKVITFYLKKNVFWHDGKPFTAHDVEFTYKAIIDKKNKSHLSSDFSNIEKFEIVDSHKVKITYKKTFASISESWEVGILPKHLLEKEDIQTSRFNREPIGTGPYKFVEWIPNDKIVIERNSKFYDAKIDNEERTPYIEKIVFRVIPDQSVMFLELQNGKIDFMEMKPDQYTKHKDQDWFKEQFKIYRYPEASYNYLGYNNEREQFKNVEIRRALSYAINVKEIIKSGLKGLAEKSLGIYNRTSPFFNDSIEVINYDPKKAKEIFAKHGWKDTNSDGYLDKNGKNFEFVIFTNNGNRNREIAVKLIQKQLKEVGIKVNYELQEWARFIQLQDLKQFDAVLLAWTVSPDPDSYNIWHSSQIPDLANDKGGLNCFSYKNVEVDKLFELGRITTDIEKRKTIYKKIQKIIYDEQPYTFLYVNENLIAVNKNIKNIKIEKNGIEYNIDEWYFEKK